MIILLLIFMIIGLGTIINHLIKLREQNEEIIEILNCLYNPIDENKDT